MAQDPIVVAFTGKRGSGKSEAVTALVEWLGFQELKFAGPLKNMLRALYRFHGVDDETIERKIEGDLKEAPCAILENLHGHAWGPIMLEAMYETCGAEMGDPMQPCEWLLGKSPGEAIYTLTHHWKAMVKVPGSTPRWAMQSVGTEWRDMIHRELWSEMFKRAVRSGGLGNRIACSDYRFPHEGATLDDLGAVKYMVRRPAADAASDQASQHSSETEIDNIPFDLVIENDGTLQDLHEQVVDYVRMGMQISDPYRDRSLDFKGAEHVLGASALADIEGHPV